MTTACCLSGEQSISRILHLVLIPLNLAESCRVLAVLLNPFLPGTSAKIYAQLGLTGPPDKLADAIMRLENATDVGATIVGAFPQAK